MTGTSARSTDRKLATALVSIATGGTYTSILVLTDLDFSFFGTDFLLALPFAIAGYFVNRWHVLIAPIFAWAPYYTGLANGWWGMGVGESWEVVMVWEIMLGCAAAGVVIWVRERVTEGRPPIC